IIAKYKPRVIGITGSVGKTSTKEAVYATLAPYFRVRRNIKNYNNEIGLPLTIIGAESGGRSILKWLAAVIKGFAVWIFPSKYPEILILEMGADHPGDLKYLTDLAKPDIGIVTAVASVHTEFFGTVEKVAEEKSILIKALPKDGVAILNFDDGHVRAMREKAECRVMTYGFEETADVKAIDSALHFHPFDSENEDRGGDAERPQSHAERGGINFKLTPGGSAVPIFLADVLGRGQVYAALAAATTGLALGLNLIQVSDALRNFKSPPGRMNILPGIKNTTIIDDTYNASPVSVAMALEVFRSIPKEEGRKFYAVLGDMLELGSESGQMHREIGWKAADVGVDILIVCGNLAKDTALGAIEGGIPESQVFHFSDAKSAGKFLQERIKRGDIILIKGSQGARMEKIVKEVMAEPQKAGELLVRQDGGWE
ncbi:MAG: Mur ligase family protein, partial [Patescibacteria group bacterium]